MLKKFILSAILLCAFYTNSVYATDPKMHAKTVDILGIGASEMDSIHFLTDDSFKRYIQIPYSIKKGQLAVVDNSTMLALQERFKDGILVPGGEVASIVANFLSLGGSAAFNTIISKDELGLLFHKNMKDLGVKSINTPEVSANKTALNMIFVTPDGERTIVAYNGVTEKITQKHITYHEIKDYKLVISEASLLDGETGNRTKLVFRAFNTGEKVKTERALHLSDVIYAKKFRTEILGNTDDIDIIMGNEAEIMGLFDTDNFDNAMKLCQNSFKICVITRGSKDSQIATHDKIYKIPVQLSDSNILDSTGAGDGFAAGFLYGYLNGKSIEESGEIAARIAAYILQQVGARPKSKLSDLLK